MNVEGFEFPDDRLYLKNHVCVQPRDGKILTGLTELGQSLSKEIVHIDLPDAGDVIPNDDFLIAYETPKAVSQIFPFECTVVSVNDRLWDDPNIINSDPYNICMVEVRGNCDEDLMTAEDACAYITEG